MVNEQEVESDLLRRIDSATHTDDLEIKSLKKYFAAKDGPAPEELSDARRGIIDAAYESINIAREKLQAAAPDETIPKPVWLTYTHDGKEVVGDMAHETMATYLSGETTDVIGKETIVIHPDTLTMFTPKELAAIYVHEAGHDIDNIGHSVGKTAKQQECIADHTAQALGYGDELASALKKMEKEIVFSGTKDHPAIPDRVAALADKAREGLAIGSVTFDDRCNITSGEPLAPQSTPTKSGASRTTNHTR